jgi:hypothetical protein
MADCSQLWAQIVKLANEMETTRVSLLNSCSETISGMMHGAFHAPNQRGAAFELIQWLPHESRKEFLSELIELASYANKYTEDARMTILELPRGWTVANIRSAYEPILQRERNRDFFVNASPASAVYGTSATANPHITLDCDLNHDLKALPATESL